MRLQKLSQPPPGLEMQEALAAASQKLACVVQLLLQLIQ